MEELSATSRSSFRGNQTELNSILMSLRVNTLIQEAESMQKRLFIRPKGAVDLAMSASPDYQVIIERVERQLAQLRITREMLCKLFQVPLSPTGEVVRTVGEDEQRGDLSEVDRQIEAVSVPVFVHVH